MRRLPFLIALVAVSGLSPDTAWGQARTVQRAVEALSPQAQARVVSEDPLLQFRTRAVAGGRIDLDEGVLRASYRIGRRVASAASPEATARAFLETGGDRFGWSDATDLTLQTVVQGRYNTHVTYQQMFHGIPVYNRFVRVNMNRAGQPTMVLSGYAPHLARLPSFNPRPALTAGTAATRVQQLVSAGGAHTDAPELVVYPSAIPRLAWRVMAWPTGLAAEWEVLIDAHSGEVIHLIDQSTHAHTAGKSRGGEEPGRQRTASRSFTDDTQIQEARRSDAPTPLLQARVDGTGLVFDPDPLTTAGVEYGFPFTDAGDTDVPELNAERLEGTLFDIAFGTDALYRLEGPFVAIDGSVMLGGNAYTPPAEADPHAFRYNRSDQAFEAVMAYYHIDTSQRYVQGLDVGRAIQAVPVRVNPHGLGDEDDSRYFPSLNGIAFGDGGVDDAEDADVIWHEYGHALLEGSAAGLLSTDEGRALHEGWADYWAASYSRGLIDAGKVPTRDWREVFTWDGNNEFWSGRSLNHRGRYPDDTRCDNGPCGNAIYTDGLLWATTLMEIYEETGREVLDRLNLASHGYLAPPTTFVDAAEALIQADLDLYGGEHLGVIIDRLGARGFVDPNTYGPIVAHEPVTHVEDTGGSLTLEVDALAVGSPVTSVALFYSIDGGDFEVLALAPQGNDRYAASLPLPAEPAQVTYYLEAADEQGLRTLLPMGAPQNTFSFEVGPDTEGPTLTHAPIDQIAIQVWPFEVIAEVTDNQGIDSVWVAYTLLHPDGSPLSNDVFTLQREQDRYQGTFPIPINVLQEGSRVRYRLHARDVARTPNETILPAADLQPFEIRIVIEGVLATFDFEGDQALAATGAWVRGVPTYGIQVAHSGERVWATTLNAAYPAEAQRSSLDLPPFNLRTLDAAYLIFWHWYDFEHSGDVAPDQVTTGTLWDGGNVKASTNDGASWVVLDPLSGYNGTIEQGTGNALGGEPAFGGYSFGWRRVIVPLPMADNVRIRFDMGTDGSNELTSLFYAGWYLDDMRIVTELPEDDTPPTLVTPPPALIQHDVGQPVPSFTVEAEDEGGIEALLVEYEIVAAAGGREQGTLRLAMSPDDLTTYLGTITTEDLPGVGDQITYRFRLRDFDGNTTVLPASNEDPFRIVYRLAERVSALRNVRASGVWRAVGQGWGIDAAEGPVDAVSSLVLEPLDLPDNIEEISFTLTQASRFSVSAGGNLKISRNGGATWTLLTPEGGYGRTYEPGAGHPMQGEQVFAGQSSGLTDALFDLSEFAGQQVRVRVDLGTTGTLQASDFWNIVDASLAYATLDDAFEVPRELALHPNFPDPFLDNTTISYTLPEAMPVRLELYNILGQRIAVLVEGDREAGTHTLTMGRGGLASGVYLLRMIAGGTPHTERMIISR